MPLLLISKLYKLYFLMNYELFAPYIFLHGIFLKREWIPNIILGVNIQMFWPWRMKF
jgi:hypothetical protein